MKTAVPSRSSPMIQEPKSWWWRRLSNRVASSDAGSWLFSRLLHRIDRPLLRLSRGRLSAARLLSGLPIISLTTTGARSGQPRTVPLVAIPDDDTIILIASNWGGTHYPAWYHNLCAHAQATITVNGRSGTFVAREASGAERERAWQRAVDLYAGYAVYAARARHRRIPVMILTLLPAE